MPVRLIDGPMGTELNARGISTPLPTWSAGANETAAEMVEAIHRDYAAAGATLLTTNTFRTKRRTLGEQWEPLARQAVRLAKRGAGGRSVAGSISPLNDCYRPDLAPPHSQEEHEELAQLLASEGCDLLLCETFPHAGEAWEAVSAAVDTGLETWLALTAGPDADLMSPAQMAEAARRAVDLGAAAVLVNCVPARDTLRFVVALSEANLGVPIGAYANAGSADDEIGWKASPSPGASAYAKLAGRWHEAGATILGGCCGIGPAHIAAMSRAFHLNANDVSGKP